MLIAIAAGEPSGDILAAGLIKAIKQTYPECQFFGIGGSEMQAAGCELLYPMERITVMGIDEALKNLLPILALRRNLAQQIVERKPDMFVGVDAPDFNIGLALKLKRQGLKTLHYVSPTVWAWRSYRIHKIKRAVDHMLTLFPFEKRYYDQHAIPATFVGHPAAGRVEEGDVEKIKAKANQVLGLKEATVVGLLPGSRNSEFAALLPAMLKAAKLLHQQDSTIQFVLPFAKEKLRQQYEQQIIQANLPITLLDGESDRAMQASDVLVLASGTAALEALLHRTPMVVVYKVSRLSYLMFKLFASVKHFSMPNHLLEKPTVLELSQEDVTGQNIANELNRYLSNPDLIRTTQQDFTNAAKQLSLDANREAASATLRLLGYAAA